MPAGASRAATRSARAALAREASSGARVSVGGDPVASAWTSARSRSSSCHCDQRMRGSPLAGRPAGRAAAGLLSRVSPTRGNSLTPVTASRRRASASRRRSRLAASRSETIPAASAARSPPDRSISWNQAQDLTASCSVRSSTYQDPPAGSMTRATWDSSTSSAWTLRATRRASLSGCPIAASKGATVIASAPPTPAEKQASVARRMLFHGSRRVSIDQELTACCRCPAASDVTPHCWATRAQTRRAARSLAIVANWSAVAA